MSDPCSSHADESSSVPPVVNTAVPNSRGYQANTLVPINRLPPEILHMVFKEVATLPEVVKHFDWRRVLRLTHVCRLWRVMVVAEASLWSHIHLHAGPRCVELFIQRSSGLPLVIYTSLHELALLNDVLDSHGVRARAVHIDHQCERSERKSVTVLDSFRWSAPRVECFVLKAFLDLELEDEPFDWHIFSEDISPLKALRLEGIGPWACIPTNFFPNLTHLLLWPASYDDYRADRLLGMLSGTPMLQYLHFIAADLTIDPDANPALPLVSLPHIHIMSIHFTDLEVALFLLRHLDLPAECAVCINGGGSPLDFSDPATFPHPSALDIPPLRLLDTVTSMDLSAWFDGFLIAGRNAPRFTSGFFIEASGCFGYWAWFAGRLHTMLPLSTITVLHVRIDEADRIAQTVPPILQHFARVHELCLLLTRRPGGVPPRRAQNDQEVIELFLGALLPAAVCPKLQVLGLEAELAHEDFPFSALEYTASARQEAGHRLARFIYHPHTRRHEAAGTRARFAASFAPLAALVDVVEYRRAADARVCPFRSPAGRGCWDVREAERYWAQPGRLMSYGADSDLGEDYDDQEPEEGSVTNTIM